MTALSRAGSALAAALVCAGARREVPPLPADTAPHRREEHRREEHRREEHRREERRREERRREGPLPATDLVFDSDRTGHFEIYAMPAAGGPARALTSDPRFDSWWARVAPDRRQILFYRTPRGVHDRDFTQTALWRMQADGSAARELRPPGTDGWALQGHAEWSPDGTRLVMFGGRRSNPQIVVTDSAGRTPRPVTARGGTNLDASWAPDGRTVVFIGCPHAVCFRSSYEVYATAADSLGVPRRLTRDGLRDHDPYVAPDGRHVAWLTQASSVGAAGVWNIRLANADGTEPRWVTDDGNINSKPEWAADGQWLYFHRLVVGRARRFQLVASRPDGTGLRELTSGEASNDEYPGR